jgi:hypothetical protein
MRSLTSQRLYKIAHSFALFKGQELLDIFVWAPPFDGRTVRPTAALAAWEPSQRYPEPTVQSLDPSFNKYRLALAGVERLAPGSALRRTR